MVEPVVQAVLQPMAVQAEQLLLLVKVMLEHHRA
jgi:hypothetical protein